MFKKILDHLRKKKAVRVTPTIFNVLIHNDKIIVSLRSSVIYSGSISLGSRILLNEAGVTLKANGYENFSISSGSFDGALRLDRHKEEGYSKYKHSDITDIYFCPQGLQTVFGTNNIPETIYFRRK